MLNEVSFRLATQLSCTCALPGVAVRLVGVSGGEEVVLTFQRTPSVAGGVHVELDVCAWRHL